MTLTCPTCTHPLYPHLARWTAEGWSCADRRTCAKRKDVADRLEDVGWMAQWGETVAGAAERLGLTSGALEKWLGNHGPVVLARLRRNAEVAA